MSTTKKAKALAVFSAVAAAALVSGCNAVEARPADSFYYDTILNLENIVNNQMKEIYDSVVTAGDTNSETILNNILYIYAETTFGSFYGENGLKAAVTSGNAEQLQAIADTYGVYEGNTELVKQLYKNVVYSIEETFLGYVTETTYQTRNVFYEEDFYDAQIAAYYDLDEATEFGRKLVDGSLRLEEGTLGTADTLVGTDAYFVDILDRYEPYIEQAVLPDIYRDLLTGQYLIGQNYRSLGLSYARKVDIISLSNSTSDMTTELVNAYADIVINGNDAYPNYKGVSYLGFEFLSNLYKGTYERVYRNTLSSEEQTVADGAAAAIYAQAGWTQETFTGDDPLDGGTSATYWKQSSLGQIYEDYSELTNNRWTDDETIRSDFTNSGAYEPEIGFVIKYNELVATSHTDHSWYTSTGMSDGTIPSAMQTRLFRINVANEVDFNTDDQGNYQDNMEMDYGWYRNGEYFLIPANYEDGSTTPYLVLDSGTWYMIKVEEAVKTSKLSETNDQSYSKMAKHSDDPLFLDEIVREVSGLLSDNSTYTNTANQYYVEQMAITFHDDDVYNYFKSTFSTLYND